MKLHRLTAAMFLLFAVALTSTAVAGPTGFGCFVEKGRLQTDWQTTCENMKAAGMNTMAFYPSSEADLVNQVETALAVGAIRTDVPVILVSNMPPLHPGPGNTNEKEWADLPGRVDEARQSAPNGDRWPEIILYGTDEPERAEQVVAWSQSYHAGGYRCTTAICVADVQQFIPYLDLLIIHASPGVLTKENVQAIQAAGKQFGVYNVQLRLASPELMRYYSGLWTWQMQPVVNLMWEWQWFAEDNPRGPARPEALAGYAEGVRDHALLQQIDSMRGLPDYDFWPGICTWAHDKWKADFGGTAATCKPDNPLAEVRP